MGLPLIRAVNTGVNAEKNFIRHGYLTVVALVLETALIFIDGSLFLKRLR